MGKKILLILFLSFFIKGCNNNDDPPKLVSPQIDFVKTFGGSSNETARSVIKTTDGGYAVLGFTQSMNGDITDKTDTSFDYWLLKFDANDNLQWSKTYGGPLDDEARSIAQTTDNGYIISGTTSSFGSGGEEIYTIKTDALGVIQWTKTYGESDGDDKSNSVIQTSDGGYVLGICNGF
ncbi:MAG: hypothetical protein COB73_08715, partial [Flavobacteriaceae bacterium]